MQQLKQVLALGAHPDYLELGCGATLAELGHAGSPFTRSSLRMAGTGPPGKVWTGAAKMRAALLALGVDSVAQHDFADTRLH